MKPGERIKPRGKKKEVKKSVERTFHFHLSCKIVVYCVNTLNTDSEKKKNKKTVLCPNNEP